jgi:hypothetical protein
MIQIPKIPEKSELEYKEKEFLLSLYENYQRSHKGWFIALLVAVVVGIPGGIILEKVLTKRFIASYEPPLVRLISYEAQALQTVRASILPVTEEISSAYAQIVNPNPQLSVPLLSYTFSFLDRSGREIKQIKGENFILAGESKLLVVPVALTDADSGAVSLRVSFDDVKWTRRVPETDVSLQILQPGQGTTAEGNFFVEGLLKNRQSFGIKSVELTVSVFDRDNQTIRAVNTTILDDIQPQESRYFRLLWPLSASLVEDLGPIQVTPHVNVLKDGIILE